jgi:hypothetical protein
MAKRSATNLNILDGADVERFMQELKKCLALDVVQVRVQGADEADTRDTRIDRFRVLLHHIIL